MNSSLFLNDSKKCFPTVAGKSLLFILLHASQKDVALFISSGVTVNKVEALP